MKNRFLNINYAIEVLNGKINTSSPAVENNTSGFDNITFTKKVDGKGYISATCIKKPIKEFMKENELEVSEYTKNGKKIIVQAHPSKFANEDMFGFMRADKEEITKEQYDALDDGMKKLYSKPNKKGISDRNITKKRVGRFTSNGLIGVTRGKVKNEWGVCATDGDSMPYTIETYSDIMSGLVNLNIGQVGKFAISENTQGFRDYDEAEAEALHIENSLPKEEIYRRIELTLRGLEHLSIKSNQTNYLVDTTPKIVIMGEYSYGNNMFQGLINKNGINIDGLQEVLEDYDDYRLSDIWIGVSNRIANEKFQGIREQLEEISQNYDFVHVTRVKGAFDGYLDFLNQTL